MKNILLASSLLLALTPGLSANDDHGMWVADFDTAVKMANESGKDLFVDFTGSDWCHWCIKLHEEVFDFDEFLDAASADYILVALDYPNAEEVKALVPNPERNAELAAEYGVRGYPTVLLMTPDGEVFGRTGYQEGGPTKYLESMHTMRSEGKVQLVKLATLKEELANAENALPVLEKAVAMLAEMSGESLGVSMVADMARQAMAKDMDNMSGLKLRAVSALLGAGQVDDELMTVARAMDSKNEEGLLEKVVVAQFGTVRDADSAKAAITAIEELLALEVLHEPGLVGTLVGQSAVWSEQNLEDHDRAVKLANAALGFRDDLPEQMLAMLNDILAEDEGEEEG
ncbi:MAG: thioredoxin-related protein [Pseudohongiellaceae bacterium]|jgi:thioredoxin-related protein